MFQRLLNIFCVAAISFCITEVASATSISFEKSKLFSEISEEARNQNKSFFVYFSAKWCGPCQIMNRTAFHDENLVLYIEENVIPVKVDIDQTIGKLWQDEFNVQAVPTMIFFDAFGQEIHRETSGMSGTKLLSLLTSFDPNTENTYYEHAHPVLVGNRDIPTINSRTVIRDIDQFAASNGYSSDDRFEIEVGNFFAQSDIDRKIKELSNQFAQHHFYIVQRRIPSGTIFQLVLAGLNSMQEAKLASDILIQRNFEPQLVKL